MFKKIDNDFKEEIKNTIYYYYDAFYHYNYNILYKN